MVMSPGFPEGNQVSVLSREFGGRRLQRERSSVKRRILRLLALTFLAGSLLFGLAVHESNPVLPDDDAYITYRYADNLVNGQGLVYNPGQRVFGSSTPLYVAWLAGLRAVARSVPTPELAVRANFIFYALTVVGVYLLLAALGGSSTLSALLAGLLGLNPELLRASLGGMETFLFTSLLVWSLWAIMSRRFRLGAWLAGLSVLARPEGILVVVVVLLSLLTSGQARRGLVGLLLPGAIWIVFATAYFGTPIYHSILAKSRPLYPLPIGKALRKLLDELAIWTAGGRAWLSSAASAICLPVLALVLAAGAFGYVARVRRGSPGDAKPSGRFGAERAVPKSVLRGALAWAAMDCSLAVPALFELFVAFYAVSNPLLFSWYYPPVEFLWFLALASGVIFAAAWLKERRGPVLASVPLLGLIGLVSVSALPPLLQGTSARHPLTDMRLESTPELARTIPYRAVTEWLNRVVRPGDTLMAPEIGSLGYRYGGRVIDACGLVSPEVLPFLPVPPNERIRPEAGAISLELVKHLQCDVIVTMQRFACRSLYPSPWFHQNYELVRQFEPILPLRDWGPGGDTVDVFFRRGGRASSLRHDGQEQEGK